MMLRLQSDFLGGVLKHAEFVILSRRLGNPRRLMFTWRHVVQGQQGSSNVFPVQLRIRDLAKSDLTGFELAKTLCAMPTHAESTAPDGVLAGPGMSLHQRVAFVFASFAHTS